MSPIPERLCNASCNHLITLGWILYVGRWGRYKNSYFVIMSLHVHICPYIICGQWFEPHSCNRSAHGGSHPSTLDWRLPEWNSVVKLWKKFLFMSPCTCVVGLALHLTLVKNHLSTYDETRSWESQTKPSFCGSEIPLDCQGDQVTLWTELLRF